MEMTGQQRIAADVPTTWAALNDPAILKDCIAGCESIERVADNEYLLQLAVRIGPVNARFKSRLFLENLQPPESYTIRFEGQGGAAGFGKGSADVRLTDDAGTTVLDYTARAQVGGKIAQIGSRLVDASARKMAEDFFAAFNARVAPPSVSPATPPAPAAVASGAATGIGDPARAGTAAGATAGAQAGIARADSDAAAASAASDAAAGPHDRAADAMQARLGPAAVGDRSGAGDKISGIAGRATWTWIAIAIAAVAVVAVLWLR